MLDAALITLLILAAAFTLPRLVTLWLWRGEITPVECESEK